MSTSPRRQRFARSACRSVCWGLLFFALFQVFLALVLELWWTSGRDPFYGTKVARLKSRLRQAPDARLVVMLGSSRTGDGLRAAPWEADLVRQLGQSLVIFNFGMPGAGPPGQLLQLQRLLAEGIKPDLVLVEIMPPLLDDRLGGDPQRLAAERLSYRDLEQLRRYPLHTHSLRQAWRQARAVPWYGQRFNVLSMVLPTILPLRLRQDGYVRCDGCGWVAPAVTHPAPAQRQRLSEVGMQSYRPILQSFQLGPASSQAVRLILEECRKRHVKTALVLMPEGPYFRRAYSERVWQQLNPFMEQLCQEYRTPLVNARCWMDEESFFDSHHLAADGASRFTQRLGHEWIVPLLRDQGK